VAALHLLRQRASALSDPLRVAVAVNLLTEEGLPHFHRFIAIYLGTAGVWQQWNNLWTAEEDRHGAALRDYSRAAGLFRMRCIERRQFDYLRRGFAPSYDAGPYHLLAYTVVQERATQIAYGKIAEAAGETEPTLRLLMLRIATEEARHFAFYRRLLADAVALDPEPVVAAAADVLCDFDMPGRNMPDFRDMAEVVRRQGLYGPLDYISIVEEVIRFCRLDHLAGVSGEAARRQEQILGLPRQLRRVAAYIDERIKRRSFSFDFLDDRAFTI
jgi:acyl-[acyl-carrier-protein] desaturase